MSKIPLHLRKPWKIRGTVVLCRSRTTGALFGIRFRIEKRRLVADYSFPLAEDAAPRHGFGDSRKLNGKLDSDPEYPGCPDNGDELFFKCGCGHLTSWTKTMENTAVCRWCGYEGPCVMGARDLSGCGDY